MSEIAVVLILALIFLGPKKLPELASGLGKMIREIKKVTAGVKQEIQLDENVRKPFEELREALTLPAEELKRRDEWKAEWEKRQQEDAALAAANPEGSEADQHSGEAHDHVDEFHHEGPSDDPTDVRDASLASGASVNEAQKSTAPAAYERTSYAGAATSGPGPNSDKTIATESPSEALADKTMISPAPTAPAFRLPTAPPAGAVASSGRTDRTDPSNRTMMGVSPAGLPARSAARPTPPPPPPAASRLPAPKLASRLVPQPEPPADSSPTTPPPDGTTPKA